MIVLLDTHALLWALEDSPRLSRVARSTIVDPANHVLVSAVSGWEIAIKEALGKLTIPDDLEQAMDAAGFAPRAISFADTRRVRTLPPHHRDPFDRMLVAQALEDGIPLVTCDPQLARYQIQLVW